MMCIKRLHLRGISLIEVDAASETTYQYQMLGAGKAYNGNTSISLL